LALSDTNRRDKMKKFTTWNIIRNGERYMRVTYLSKFSAHYVLTESKQEFGFNDLTIEFDHEFESKF
jgi:hypothetical protein